LVENDVKLIVPYNFFDLVALVSFLKIAASKKAFRLRLSIFVYLAKLSICDVSQNEPLDCSVLVLYSVHSNV
jgi:hypothetical protein